MRHARDQFKSFETPRIVSNVQKVGGIFGTKISHFSMWYDEPQLQPGFKIGNFRIGECFFRSGKSELYHLNPLHCCPEQSAQYLFLFLFEEDPQAALNINHVLSTSEFRRLAVMHSPFGAPQGFLLAYCGNSHLFEERFCENATEWNAGRLFV
jgi:hypothetical protein